ncbi:MAG TPA: hypothetical protein VM915_06325 [Verrucomicrobiae bacterium]|jgi:hypothetical protein|nr:hypothetical protein [Verrucomicrobiae bacterium]
MITRLVVLLFAFVAIGARHDAHAQVLPREHTRVHVILVPDALDQTETEWQDVAYGSHIATQRLSPRSVVRLEAEVAVRGATWGDSPIRLEAGAELVAASDGENDRFYCAARRRPGLVPIRMWACLEDVDQDGVFDRGGQANPVMGVNLPMPYSVFTMSPARAVYAPVDVGQWPNYEVAIAYRRINRGTLGFTLLVRSEDGEDWDEVAPTSTYVNPWAFVQADALPRTIELFGAQIEVRSYDPETRAISARLARGFPEDGFSLSVGDQRSLR